MTSATSSRVSGPLGHALRFGALAGWCGVVWVLSAQSDPEQSVGFSLELPDWALHGVEFAVGGSVARHAFAPLASARRATVAALVFCLCWGLIDEWHQSHVPGRDPSAQDVGADLVGAALGATLHALARRRHD